MIICLSDIEIYAYHGVLPQEKQVGGWYGIGSSLTIADEKATETDALEDTVNYAAVYEVIKEEMAVPSKLIEHAAGRIARRIKNDFTAVEKVCITLTKKHPPIVGANIKASVELCL